MWKKPTWAVESHFLVHAYVLRTGEEIAPVHSMGRRHIVGSSVIICAMICWETVGLDIHAVVTHCKTQYAIFMITVFLNCSGLFQHYYCKIFRNDLMNMTKTLWCSLGLYIPHMSDQACVGCTGQTILIHKGPTSQFTALKG